MLSAQIAAKPKKASPSRALSQAAQAPSRASYAPELRSPDRHEGETRLTSHWSLSGISVFSPSETSLSAPPFRLQRKSTFQSKHEPLEAEADELADRAIRHSQAAPASQATSPSSAATPCCAQCQAKAHPTLQAKSASAQPQAPTQDLPEPVHYVLRSPGRPLESRQRTPFESAFGRDLSGVRIHTGPAASQAAASVSALAFTVGSNVVFGSNRYQPSSLEGRRLLAHELVHTIQQGSPASLPYSAGPHLRSPSPAPHQIARQEDPATKPKKASVGVITVYLGGPGKAKIKFDTGSGSILYTLDSIGNLVEGHYNVQIEVVNKKTVAFHVDDQSGKLFHFTYNIAPGQPNPATLFAGNGSGTLEVTRAAAPAHQKDPIPPSNAKPADPLTVRVNRFKGIVKAAGRLRMAENSKALAQWLTFLEQKLTPRQVEHTVYAQQVRDLQITANKEGGRTLDAYDEAMTTANPIRREKAVGQVRGQYRACTGCHLETQAVALDHEQSGMRHTGLSDWTPIQKNLQDYAAEERNNPMARPTGLQAAPGEGLAKKDEIHDPQHPGATSASASLATLQPFLQILGPGYYDVLPSDILVKTPEPKALLALIASLIEKRRAGYARFSQHIAEPDFDYLTLRPIVRDLLPLQEDDVQQAIQREIEIAEDWAKVERVLMWGVTIGLLLLSIFPPTSAIGIAGLAAVEGGMGAYAIGSGIKSMQEGYWLSQTTGANNVTDPEQQQAAGMMMAVGLLTVVLGALGLKASAAKGIKLLRSAAAPAAGAAAATATSAANDAIDGLEGIAGGNHIKISEISSGSPKVKVTSPTGDTLYDGPLKDMPQEGFGAGHAEPLVKPTTKMFATQRASALEQSALSTESRAAELEARAGKMQDAAKAAQFKAQADQLRAEAVALRNESSAYASGAKSPTADLPGAEDVDAAIDRLAAGDGGPQQHIQVKLNPADKAADIERLSRGIMRTPRGRVVFRVEGGGSRGLSNIDAASGAIKVTPSTTYINVGSVERALEFLAKRSAGSRIVAFEIDEAWAQSVRSGAVPEASTKFLTGKVPKLVDVKYAQDQFEIPGEMVPEMEKFIVPGSAKVILTK